MSHVPQNHEPENIVAGDSLTWYIKDNEHPPSDGWALTYSLTSSTTTTQLNTTVNMPDDRFEMNVLVAVTSTWVPGTYRLTRTFSRGTERVSTHTLLVNILPDPQAISPVNPLTPAAIGLVQVNLALTGNLEHGVDTVSVDGVSITKMSISDLLTLKTHYEKEIRKEQVVNGTAPSRTIHLRFC